MTAGQPFHTSIDKLAPAASDRISALIEEAVPEVAPALALSVWRSGAPWYEAYAGWVEPEERHVPVGFGTRFDLGTLSRVFTATAVLRLANDFKIELDDAVARLVPELGGPGPRGVDGGAGRGGEELRSPPQEHGERRVDPSPVTFRQLLTHTAGLAARRSIYREVGPVPPPPDQPDPVSLDERWAAGLEALCRSPFVARPGEEVHESDLGYMLLGMALARRVREPLSTAMHVLIRDRLGLDTLGYRPLEGGRPRTNVVPTSIDADWRGRRCWGEVEDANAAALGGVAGHAGLFASVHDVARFGVAWLRSDPRLRLERSRRSAVTDQSGIGAARGLGWCVQPSGWLEAFGPDAYGEHGSTGTSLVVDPSRDLVVALLANPGYAGSTDEAIETLRAELHLAVAGAFEPGP